MKRTSRPGFYLEEENISNQTAYEELLGLLFTNGELDVEKLLCLHILSSNPKKVLELPRRPLTSTSFLDRKQSPLEKLIERCRARNASKLKTSSQLPQNSLSTLDACTSTATVSASLRSCSSQCSLILEHLQSRLNVASDLSPLVEAICFTLQKSSPEKMSRLLEVAKQHHDLKDLWRKAELREFLVSLSENSLISSSRSEIMDSYSPSVISIKPVDVSKTLNKLVRRIQRRTLDDIDEHPNKTKLQKLNGSSDLKRRLRKFPCCTARVLRVVNYSSDDILSKCHSLEETPKKAVENKTSYAEYCKKFVKERKKNNTSTAKSNRRNDKTRKDKETKKSETKRVSKENSNESQLGDKDDFGNRNRYEERDILLGGKLQMGVKISDDNRDVISKTETLSTSGRIRKFHCPACLIKWRDSCAEKPCFTVTPRMDKEEDQDYSRILPIIVRKEQDHNDMMKKLIADGKKDWKLKEERHLERSKRKPPDLPPGYVPRRYHQPEITWRTLRFQMTKKSVPTNKSHAKVEKFLKEPLF